jgi:hypothetical protein
MLSVIMENSINRLYNFQLLLFIADSFSYLLDTQTSVERGSAILLPILVSPIDSDLKAAASSLRFFPVVLVAPFLVVVLSFHAKNLPGIANRKD